MDMANLSNEQQTVLFKSQSLLQSLFTDSAAENATSQMNASSENQVNQFYDSLRTTTAQFNAAQKNAMEQFTASEGNSIEKFNTEIQNARDLFESTNSIAIAQANATWRQGIATTEFAAQQESNMQDAMAATGMSAASLSNLWQRESDLLDYSFRAAESSADRVLALATLKLTAEQETKLQGEIAKGNLTAWGLKTLGDLLG